MLAGENSGGFRFAAASRMMAAVKARTERDEVWPNMLRGPHRQGRVRRPPSSDEHRAPRASPSDGVSSEALDAAKAGDEDAFRLMLYRAVQPALLRYLRGLVGEDAEDVTSEAWVQIARDIGSFRGDLDGFRGWAATIARNRALDHLRSMRRRPVSAMSLDDLLRERPHPMTPVFAALAVGVDRRGDRAHRGPSP